MTTPTNLKVRLLRNCRELKAGEILTVFHDGARYWASRDGTKNGPYCSGDHGVMPPEKPDVWQPIRSTKR